MDNPKKAAKKLLQFYQGEKLKELLEYLNKGLESSPDRRRSKNTSVSDRAKKTIQDDSQVNDSFVIDDSPKPIPVRSRTNTILNNKKVDSKLVSTETSKISEEKTTSVTSEQTEIKNNPHNSELTSQVDRA